MKKRQTSFKIRHGDSFFCYVVGSLHIFPNLVFALQSSIFPVYDFSFITGRYASWNSVRVLVETHLSWRVLSRSFTVWLSLKWILSLIKTLICFKNGRISIPHWDKILGDFLCQRLENAMRYSLMRAEDDLDRCSASLPLSSWRQSNGSTAPHLCYLQ